MAVEVWEFAMRAGEVDPMPGAIIVAGLARCGMALTMDMLARGGLPVGGARPPFYENPVLPADVLGAWRQAIPGAATPLPIFVLKFAGLSPALTRAAASWFAQLEGQAVKVTMMPLVHIPPGNHRAVWLDRDDGARIDSLFNHLDVRDRPGLRQRMIAKFASSRAGARDALLRAGAVILDVAYEDLTADDAPCRAAVDRIVEHVGVELDRDAMVERAAEYRRRDCDRDRLVDHRAALRGQWTPYANMLMAASRW